MWKTLGAFMRKAGLDPVRIENSLELGTPDVNYTGGWLELKFAREWPRRGGPLKLAHFTPQQNAWIVRRVHAGGVVAVVLKVGKEWYALPGGPVTQKFYEDGLLRCEAEAYAVQGPAGVVRRVC